MIEWERQERRSDVEGRKKTEKRWKMRMSTKKKKQVIVLEMVVKRRKDGGEERQRVEERVCELLLSR